MYNADQLKTLSCLTVSYHLEFEIYSPNSIHYYLSILSSTVIVKGMKL